MLQYHESSPTAEAIKVLMNISVILESYISFDDSLENMEELATKSIAEQVQALQPIEEEEEEEEEDCDDKVPVPVTLAEAENISCDTGLFRMLDQMEGSTSQLTMSSKQTVLIDFSLSAD